jgi:type IV pilus assembly protein PilA
MCDWYYSADGDQRHGPLTTGDLVAQFRYGRIGLDTLIWRDSQAQWQPLSDFAAELGLIGSAGRPPLPPPSPAFSPAANVSGTTRSGLSGCMIALIVVSVLAVPVVAILAAIAIPAYQDYVVRAKVAVMMAANDPLKAKVAEYREQHQVCPSNKDLGVREGDVTSESGRVIVSATVGTFDNGGCGIELRTISGSPALDGKAVWLEHDIDTDTWQCSSEVENRYLPQACRE